MIGIGVWLCCPSQQFQVQMNTTIARDYIHNPDHLLPVTSPTLASSSSSPTMHAYPFETALQVETQEIAWMRSTGTWTPDRFPLERTKAGLTTQ